MSVLAYITPLASGAATPTTVPPPATPFGWHEPFDEANDAALWAIYDAIPDSFDSRPSSYGTDITVAGGSLNIKGSGLGTSGYYVNLGPGSATVTKAPEFWYRIIVEMAGGAYDNTGDPINMFIWSSPGVLETDLDTTETPDGFFAISAYPDNTHGNSGVARALPVGTHTFIVCVSEDDATHQRSELWYNAAPGDAPLATAITSKTAGEGFNVIDWSANGPLDPALTLKVDDVQVTPGNRASNPFGIL